MNILDRVHSSADVKRLPESELPALCAALREEILQTVARNGGHLASSLGAVELMVALHRVYDSASDRLVFDVGHQCYAHKLMTGRRERFGTLRQLDGLSGFPRPEESPDDAAVAGHASTSISVALGMARARTLTGGTYDVAAIIGDGALTGGTAYEGLADCGAGGEPIVVVLNDNTMSISENVGGMARALSKVRLRPGYIAFKQLYRRTVGRSQPLYRFLHRLKERTKDLFLPDNMFEDMGFYYLGPVDGHDLKALVRTLDYARAQRIPVLVHVCTSKGRGYAPAEQSPMLYHGVGPFDPAVGVQAGAREDFSSRFGKALCRRAESDPTVVAVTAAMTEGTGLGTFAKQYPRRFFDVGIAEGHAAAMAAGMARQGLKPVFAVYSTFLQRAYDMLLHDISLSGEHVVLAVDRAGLVGADGATHQGAFDVAFLGSVPGMKLWAPANYAELDAMLSQALEAEGPCALRYPRGAEGAFRENTAGRAAAVVQSGTDVTLISYGILINETLEAAALLAARGLRAEVIKLNRLDCPDMDLVSASVRKTGRLAVAEEAAAPGGMGERIAAALFRSGLSLRSVLLLNLGDGIVPHGSVPALRRALGLDAAGIAESVERMIHEEATT